jgi:membrane-associated protein
MFGIDLTHLIESIGYIGITAIIFTESGLFFGFFLPGDSLLFTAGVLASGGVFNIYVLVVLTTLAAIAGNSFGYWFGNKVGPAFFSRPDTFFFNKKRIAQSEEFFKNHGIKSIILARFVPAARTLVPILAGVGNMHYGTFLFYNIIGSLLWALLIPLTGYFLGTLIPDIDRYLLPIVGLLILISVLPILHSYMSKKT